MGLGFQVKWLGSVHAKLPGASARSLAFSHLCQVVILRFTGDLALCACLAS